MRNSPLSDSHRSFALRISASQLALARSPQYSGSPVRHGAVADASCSGQVGRHGKGEREGRQGRDATIIQPPRTHLTPVRGRERSGPSRVGSAQSAQEGAAWQVFNLRHPEMRVWAVSIPASHISSCVAAFAARRDRNRTRAYPSQPGSSRESRTNVPRASRLFPRARCCTWCTCCIRCDRCQGPSCPACLAYPASWHRDAQ